MLQLSHINKKINLLGQIIAWGEAECTITSIVWGRLNQSWGNFLICVKNIQFTVILVREAVNTKTRHETNYCIKFVKIF